MKKTIVMLSAICFLALAAQATSTVPPSTKQEAKTGSAKHESPEQRAQQSVDKLDKIVGLSADQKTQVHALAMTRIKTVASIHKKYKGQADKKETAKEEIKGARKEYRNQVKKLLTPDQIQKLKAYHKANKGKAQADIPSNND